MEFAPITSVGMERCFSPYAYLLSNRRKAFSFDNLRMVSIVVANL